jgi:hypothetical protein
MIEQFQYSVLSLLACKGEDVRKGAALLPAARPIFTSAIPSVRL